MERSEHNLTVRSRSEEANEMSFRSYYSWTSSYAQMSSFARVLASEDLRCVSGRGLWWLVQTRHHFLVFAPYFGAQTSVRTHASHRFFLQRIASNKKDTIKVSFLFDILPLVNDFRTYLRGSDRIDFSLIGN